jgi:hypothetical protein
VMRLPSSHRCDIPSMCDSSCGDGGFESQACMACKGGLLKGPWGMAVAIHVDATQTHSCWRHTMQKRVNHANRPALLT